MAEAAIQTFQEDSLAPEKPAKGLFWTSALRLMRHPQGAFGLSLTVFLVIVALGAPYFAPYDPLVVRSGQELKAPFGQYVLGTDQYGRDILSRIIWGTRV